MIQYLNVFFYDIYPYLCGTVFILGSWLRYDYGQYTWRAASSQMLDKRGMVLWSNLFHIGILGIFFGHLFGMLTPHWMYAWFLPVAVKQQMAMILGGICGVLTLIGGAGLLLIVKSLAIIINLLTPSIIRNLAFMRLPVLCPYFLILTSLFPLTPKILLKSYSSCAPHLKRSSALFIKTNFCALRALSIIILK